MTWIEMKQRALDEWRDKIRAKIEEERKPLKVEIIEAWHYWSRYDPSHASLGSFKRKSKGLVYESPRILLHWYFKKLMNRGIRNVMEARVKINNPGWYLDGDQEALIIILGRPREEGRE